MHKKRVQPGDKHKQGHKVALRGLGFRKPLASNQWHRGTGAASYHPPSPPKEGSSPGLASARVDQSCMQCLVVLVSIGDPPEEPAEQP